MMCPVKNSGNPKRDISIFNESRVPAERKRKVDNHLVILSFIMILYTKQQ